MLTSLLTARSACFADFFFEDILPPVGDLQVGLEPHTVGVDSPQVDVPDELYAAVPDIDFLARLPAMFVNAVNCAEFGSVQHFFRAHMHSHGRILQVNHALPAHIKLPSGELTGGGRAASSYLLGCFVQCPDMALLLTGHRTFPRNNMGPVVHMDVEVRATMTHGVRIADWVPQATGNDDDGDGDSGGEESGVEFRSQASPQLPPFLTRHDADILARKAVRFAQMMDVKLRGNICLFLDGHEKIECIQICMCGDGT